MSYRGYSSAEYTGEVKAILREKYRGEPSAESWRTIYDAWRDGVSPLKAAQRVAYEAKLRRKERFWYGAGPRIEGGYAEKNRVGGRGDWRTVIVRSSLNKRARFIGFRRIEGTEMAVWKVGNYLIAQTAVGPRHPSQFKTSGDRRSRDRSRGRRR
jgi:hypothetical protein